VTPSPQQTTPTETETPAATPTPAASATVTATAADTPVPAATATATQADTPAETATAGTPEATATPTATETEASTPTATEVVTATSTPDLPTSTVTMSVPTATATMDATTTETPSPSPTATPTEVVAAQQQFCETLSGDDGRLNRTSFAYPPQGGTVVNTSDSSMDTRRSRRNAGDFSVGVVLMRFDTAALPDNAVITAAWLDVHVLDRRDSDGRNLVAEFVPATTWPLTAGAYTDLAPAQNQVFEVAVGALVPGQLTSIAVDTALADQQVSRTGATGLRLHISGDQPTGPNYVEVATYDHSTQPEPCLVVDYVYVVGPPTPTPTETPTPRDPRPLGAVTVLATPSAPNNEYSVRVVCPEVGAPESVLLMVDEPTQLPLRGTIVFATGFTGKFYWQSYAAEAPRVLDELRAAGFRTVQMKWVDTWFNGSLVSYEGHSRLACRPATVVQWVHDNLYAPGPDTAFCATGHSNGAGQMAYVLAHYGLADLFSVVVLDGGPNWTRIDPGCIQDDPAYQSLWLNDLGRSQIDWAFGFFQSNGPCFFMDAGFRDEFQEASVGVLNYQYVYPNTTVSFLFGQLDASVAAAQGRLFHDRLVDAGSPFVTLNIIPGGGHEAANTSLGADLLRDIFIVDCHP
jgi:hypothetical protein